MTVERVWDYPRPPAIAPSRAPAPDASTPHGWTTSAVHTQESDFYGGWITSDLIGPFKGPPGTLAW